MITNYRVEKRPSWRWWVTPKSLQDKPIHRWYVFPHSFTDELVHALIQDWELEPKDLILDPFVGAGTTLLAAKEKGVPARGYDLSPLAVLATRAKIANYDLDKLKKAWAVLDAKIDPADWNGVSRDYPELVKKALPGAVLGAFDEILKKIGQLAYCSRERNFFKLVLLTAVPHYSRAVATGGWLKWVKKRSTEKSLLKTLDKRVQMMFDDLREAELPHHRSWRVAKADARRLPDENATYSAVITSPPYPNRHDYTRVFGVELMFGFLNWNGTRALRYQSFHSHPESHPKRPDSNRYVPPAALVRALERIRKARGDARIPSMLGGYFLDMYLCLREMKRVCRRKAHVALVVGNAQYHGVPIRVDEITAQIGEQLGLHCEKLIVTRYRGNSAQQMGLLGKRPSRESLVIFCKQ